jgi:hypothetical protein
MPSAVSSLLLENLLNQVRINAFSLIRPKKAPHKVQHLNLFFF